MSLLYYISLPGVGPWNDALFSTGAQLGPYAHYLRTAIQALKDAKPVLAWREPTPAEARILDDRLRARHERALRRAAEGQRRRDRHTPSLPDGVWIVLEPPPDRPEEPEDTFDKFLEADSLHDEPTCARDSAIEINGFDREGRALLLSRLPERYRPEQEDEDGEAPGEPLLWLRPNTYPLQCQLNALRALENRPTPRLAPLMRLLSPGARWDDVEPRVLQEADWLFLTRPDRDGTAEQREFVAQALETPDFAILEGPPGSGKTTAICELIAQLTRDGKRVLLVASTHVAVDNVLERLLAWQERAADKPLLPLRIGDEQRASDAVKSWIYKHILRTWDDELLDFLDNPKNTDPQAKKARAALKGALTTRKDKESSALARLLLESSNLVCGTTIGILQHPAIKQARGAPVEPFDVMILDEASKTTFTEFLVPALHARRWIVVGDIRQLSPYVEEVDITASIRGLLPPAEARAVVHTFLADSDRVGSLVAVADDDERALLLREAEARELDFVDLDLDIPEPLYGVPDALAGLLYSRLVFGTPDALRRHERRLPGDLRAVGGPVPPLPRWQAHRAALATEPQEADWASEVAWRLIRWYELRLNEDESAHLKEGLAGLLPCSSDEQRWQLQRSLTTIRRVARPSILELLQRGFEQLDNQRASVALTDGLPEDVLAARHVALAYQHRMHPDISRFPREQFYTPDDAEANEDDILLRDSATMARDRQWTYTRYARRAVWIHVDEPPKRQRRRGNVHLGEVDRVLKELGAFVAWARENPRSDGRPWEVAVLTFYRGQEAALRERLQAAFRQPGNFHNFSDGARTHVSLCTVDRFQGHEADLVLLSFVKTRSVGFLNSPNRLNVALTRARFQIVLIGHHAYFASDRCRSPLLRALAGSAHYAHEITWSTP